MRTDTARLWWTSSAALIMYLFILCCDKITHKSAESTSNIFLYFYLNLICNITMRLSFVHVVRRGESQNVISRCACEVCAPQDKVV